MEKDYNFERNKIISGQRKIYFLLAVVILFFIFSPWIGNKDHKGASDYVARVKLEGDIFTDHNMLEKLSAINDNDHIKGVILRINSGGGTVHGSESLYNTISKINENIPVVAVIQDICASGAYMTALGATRIFAAQSSMVGSIGVYTEHFEITELMKKLGIKHNMVKTTAIKGSPNLFEKTPQVVTKHQQELITDVYKFFQDMVKTNRKLTDDEINVVSSGKVYAGQRALDLKLIDEIGDEQTAFDWLVGVNGIGKDFEIIDYEIHEPEIRRFPNFFSKFIGKFTSSLKSALTDKGSTLPELKIN